MNDRELLELAAKAAGHERASFEGCPVGWCVEGAIGAWNPLDDDRDALRLAVRLKLDVSTSSAFALTWVRNEARGVQEVTKHGDDPYAATRRAIVRAAAALADSASA